MTYAPLFHPQQLLPTQFSLSANKVARRKWNNLFLEESFQCLLVCEINVRWKTYKMVRDRRNRNELFQINRNNGKAYNFNQPISISWRHR